MQNAIQYAKHPTNTRLYVLHALGSKWHIFKTGYGQRCTYTGKLTRRTTRFVATEQTPRGRVVSAPTLHEVISKLQFKQTTLAIQTDATTFFN
jgi:hypothetical protein